MWGGTISDFTYSTPYADLTAAQSEQQFTVTFTPTQSSAVLAWGGHIASRLDWGFTNGVPNSAGGISGSPYHMRVKGWTLGNLGQQDRSLAAAAVIPPPECNLTGPTTACANDTENYSTTVVADTYTWSIINDSRTEASEKASISAGQGTTQITVSTGTTAGTYTVKLVTVKNGITSIDECVVTTTVSYPPTNNVTDRIHCHDDAGAAITFSSPVSGTTTTFAWTSTLDVGFGTSGSTHIPAYTASNTTNAQVVATVTVVATVDGCAGPAETFTVTVNPNPTINTPAVGAICVGATTASISYSAVSTGADQYKIVWDATAVAAGLVSNTDYISLPTSPFNITVSGTLGAASYNGQIFVKNSTTSCESDGDNISLVVNPNPVANPITAPSAQCIDDVNGNTFDIVASGSNGTPSWAVQTNTSNLTVLFESGQNSYTPSVNISGGHGVVTLRLTVTSGFTPSCGTDTEDVNLTVNNEPTAPAVTYTPPACDETTFSVSVDSPIIGATYTIKDKNSASISGISPAESITPTSSSPTATFTNIPAGSGYQVSVTNTSGCTSGINSCGTATTAALSMEINNTAELKIKEDISSHSLSAYPTPFTNSMTLNYVVKTDGNYQVNLYDMTGKLIRTVHTGFGQAGSQERSELDGRLLKSGIYLIAITNGTERQTLRIVKKE